MKKEYISPSVEIVSFSLADVLNVIHSSPENNGTDPKIDFGDEDDDILDGI